MSNKRAARRNKQIRRDQRRAKKRDGDEAVADTAIRDAIRRALAGGHPLDLLGMASMVIHVGKSQPPNSCGCALSHLDGVIADLIGESGNREMTVLLAVVAELLVDDPALQLRCRRELAERGEHPPRWITALPRVDAYRAVRRTNVFGDFDEVVIGMRLDDRHELTIAVQIDHNMFSSVADVGAVPEPIESALARTAEISSDTSVFDMSLADTRAWFEDALDKPAVAPTTDAWPLCRPLIQWLVSRLPDGGERRAVASNWEASEELCDRFFATRSAAPFSDPGHRELLLELFETGTGDPLRWSPARLEQAIEFGSYAEDYIALEVSLDVPDLLRAFIPYAHAQSRIRDELTSDTLEVLDALRSSYKRDVLRRAARYWGLDDAV